MRGDRGDSLNSMSLAIKLWVLRYLHSFSKWKFAGKGGACALDFLRASVPKRKQEIIGISIRLKWSLRCSEFYAAAPLCNDMCKWSLNSRGSENSLCYRRKVSDLWITLVFLWAQCIAGFRNENTWILLTMCHFRNVIWNFPIRLKKHCHILSQNFIS